MAVLNKIYNVTPFSNNQRHENFKLHNLIKYILLVAQCFSLFPVNGIHKDVKDIKFKWISIKAIYSYFTIIVVTFYTIFVTIHTFKNSENFFSFVVVVWNVRAVVGLIIFLRLSRKWPKLIREWDNVELTMVCYGPINNLKRRFKILPWIYLLCGLIEHFLFVYGGIRKLSLDSTVQNKVYIKIYFKILYGEFFDDFEYTHWRAVVVEFVAIISTFLWQFANMFITLLSSALAERLRQITNAINSQQAQNESEWRNLRKHFNNLSLLCKSLNNAFAEIVLLVFIGNLYFLSISILQCLTPRTGYEAFYFWYGMIFNGTHFVVLCMYASWVYEESFEPISEIASVKHQHLSHEVDRFLHQMAGHDIAINGAGLFKITRGVILKIASVITTLQLIFIQFNTRISSNI